MITHLSADQRVCGRLATLRWGDCALADAVAEPSWLRGAVRAAMRDGFSFCNTDHLALMTPLDTYKSVAHACS
ncbi:MAG: hypothetical protein NTY53_09085, partial [Kiritimatiellaeota bacterium]|nr:hypothetical protein [Kiritimatiellota bacterium]